VLWQSLDVAHGFVFRRSLHREVGWFLAFQDAVDVGGGKPIQRGLINPEGDQSALGDDYQTLSEILAHGLLWLDNGAIIVSLAQAYVFNVFGWLAEAARG
jgi:hypothetical protein